MTIHDQRFFEAAAEYRRERALREEQKHREELLAGPAFGRSASFVDYPRMFEPPPMKHTGPSPEARENEQLKKRIAMLEAERGPGMKAPQPTITCDLGEYWE